MLANKLSIVPSFLELHACMLDCVTRRAVQQRRHRLGICAGKAEDVALILCVDKAVTALDKHCMLFLSFYVQLEMATDRHWLRKRQQVQVAKDRHLTLGRVNWLVHTA